MRIAPVSFCLAGIAALAGCAAGAPAVLRGPVGPQHPQLAHRRTDGELIVYSASRTGWYAQAEYPVHTDYTIFSLGDKVVRRVDNRAGSFYQDPAKVGLLPGEYRVKALATGGGFVVVPVIIEAGETTVVDLDGTGVPP